MVNYEAQAKIAFIDGLTKIGNRSCFNRDSVNSQNMNFTLFMIDIN